MDIECDFQQLLGKFLTPIVVNRIIVLEEMFKDHLVKFMQNSGWELEVIGQIQIEKVGT